MPTTPHRPLTHLAAVILTTLFLLPLPTQAALDFHTYRIIKQTVETTGPDGKKQEEIRTSYELTRLGSVTLEASSLTLTSHGSYLTVVEEATLSGNVEYRPRDITYDFLLQGTLPIPPLAAVHSLSVLHGDTLFRGSLRKATYSLNDVFFDTASLQATLDTRVAYLQQHSDRVFEACFTKLALGEPVRVRIEYDLPFPGAPGAAIRVPVLFHPSGTPPRQAQITFFEKSEGLPPVQWLSPSGRVTLSSAGTHTVEYQREYQFRRDEAPSTLATLQATAFEAGRIKGEYLLFKGGLNDSLMDRLSRPLEVVFLWRWNPPYRFVELQNGLKTLSPLGQTVAQQARILRQIVKELGPRGHRFGLLHIAPGREETFIAPGEEGGARQDSLLAYLARFDEAGLYTEFKDYKDERLPWAATTWDDSGAVRKGQQEFLAALRRIRAGFGDNAEALRHIALIGVGGAPTSLIDLKSPEPLEDILDSVTIANVNAAWPGVDLGEALEVKTRETLRPLALEAPVPGTPGILFPVFQPTSVEYRAFTASRSHAVVMPFSAKAERQAVLKAESPFADSLHLQGIDALGRKTRILALEDIRVLRRAADSGLARLWAADPDRIAESHEVDLGMRYGILTKGSYFAAGVGEGMLTSPGQASALPRRVQVARTGSVFSVEGAWLRIQAGPEAAGSPVGARLEIFDAAGRLVLSLPLDAFRRAGGFAVPMYLLKRLGRGRILLVLRGAGRMHTFAMTMGGRI